jgi:hypothetical protein
VRVANHDGKKHAFDCQGYAVGEVDPKNCEFGKLFEQSNGHSEKWARATNGWTWGRGEFENPRLATKHNESQGVLCA